MKNLKRINLLGCPVDNLTMDETLSKIDTAIKNRDKIHHVVVNAAKLVNMQRDSYLKEAVINSDIINADGQSIVWASQILGKPLPERVTGIDLMNNLVELSFKNNYKIFFLGAKENIVRKVIEKYSEKYSEKIIAGYNNGYFDALKEQDVINSIISSRADILLVAMTSPKKEIFLNKYKNQLNVPFVMGVGGSFDVVAGFTKRAPFWMQNSGLEWLYRVYQEPKRMWKRYLTTNSLFILYILKEFMVFNLKKAYPLSISSQNKS